jgi:prepilin-type N-terminal cleavage/methylation domain-containing protein
MKRQKGFTLIELLVVIAIIGILSAIVLASLNSARNKAQDAKVQAQLSNMRAAAEVYYSNNGSSYGTAADCTSGLFTDGTSGMGALVTATAGSACGSNGTAWAVEAPLVSDSGIIYCVDSTGASREATSLNVVTNNITVCPV